MRERCEHCKYYGFWDSAYGHCLRYPPVIKRTTHILFKPKFELIPILIEWDRSACGEFVYKVKEVK